MKSFWARAGAGLIGLMLASMLAGMIPANALAASTKPAAGGTLTVVGSLNFPNEDPASPSVSTSGQQLLLYAIYGSLFDAGPHGQPLPDLATGYLFSRNHSILTLDLRHGVVFSDGTPFNSTAVRFNILRDANPSNGCTCGAFLSTISSVTTPTPYKVVIYFSAPYVPILNVFEDSGPAYIVSPTAFNSEGAKFAHAPVGAGPYVVATDNPNVSMTLTKSPTFWNRKHVYINTVVANNVAVPATAYASIESGAAQYQLLPDAATLGLSHANPNVKIITQPATQFSFIKFQTNKPPFNNILAREAVLHAIDMAPIAKTLLSGLVTPSSTIFGSGLDDIPPQNSIKGYPFYNPSKAASLVSQIPGGLTFQLLSEGDTPQTIAIMTALQQQLSAVGIKMVQEPTATVPAAVADEESGNFQGMLAGNLLYTDPGMYSTFYFSSKSITNNGFQDAHVDALLAKADATTVPAQRIKYFTQLSQYLVNKAYIVPLYTQGEDNIETNTLHQLVKSPLIYLSQMWLS